jgi:hypothetical protein
VTPQGLRACDALRSLLANWLKVITHAAAPLKDHRIALDGLFQGNRLVAVAVRALRRNLQRETIRHAADPTSSVCHYDRDSVS